MHELETDAATYEWLDAEDVQVQVKATGARNAFALPEFVDSIRALAIFNVTVANSTIFAVVRKFQETTLIKQSQAISVLKLVESFHFQYTALTNSTSTGGTRARYNRFAVRLENAKSASEVAAAIADLKKRLHDSLPDRAKAHLAFRSLFYAPKLNLTRAQVLRSRKIFIAYVLMSFAKLEHLLPAGQNLRTWSIEHIKPQSKASLDYRDPVYSIGNLTLLTEGLNSALGDAPLSSKIDELRKGSAYFDPELESWDASSPASPSDAQIDKRSHFMADDALDRVWNL
ncbi:HNH endonuclease family protein [Streptomyces sp. MS1.HAVA.3]|uniref:HNH endonuclease family protein n=1 Tax=Streptomyces caledonius TaxID=3134107 RepID=A0ABU8U9I4_9ACTN